MVKLNGESFDVVEDNISKLKEIFPDIEFTDMAFTVHAVTAVTSNGVNGHISYDFWKDWWNAPYKGVQE